MDLVQQTDPGSTNPERGQQLNIPLFCLVQTGDSWLASDKSVDKIRNLLEFREIVVEGMATIFILKHQFERG